MQGRLAARYNAASDAGWSSQVARRAHNPEVAGSNPAPATGKAPRLRGVSYQGGSALGTPAISDSGVHGGEGTEDRGRGRRSRVVPQRPAPSRPGQRTRDARLHVRSNAPISDSDQPGRSSQDPALAIRPDPRSHRLPRVVTAQRGREASGVRTLA